MPEQLPTPLDQLAELTQELHQQQALEEQAREASFIGRIIGSRLGRTGLASAVLLAGGMAVAEEPHSPETRSVAADLVPHQVYRTGGDGVWLHDGPGLSSSNSVIMPDGAQFNVDCFILSDNVQGNPVWLQGEYNGSRGAVTDYYINTHWDTTQDLVDQGIEQCGTEQSSASAPTEPAPEDAREQENCYFNFKWTKTNLTFSYEGDHRYYGNAWQAAKNWSDLGW